MKDNRSARSGHSACETPVEHSVYLGRQRLGRYSRVSPKLYAAFDAEDRQLGVFFGRRAAYAAISNLSNCQTNCSDKEEF
ncbi:hypothetical protein [Bradyrhizobium viridifuturi]|uniref:hypothetical protein n=1 Tax=Bradyrhizobium viridifuturi TaxID=1654716 RepID=UPI000AA5E27D|nr:hypothetical protein [Bradyrhizobium viridifuturi]